MPTAKPSVKLIVGDFNPAFSPIFSLQFKEGRLRYYLMYNFCEFSLIF